MQRIIGSWTIEADYLTHYSEGWNEDGPFTRKTQCLEVLATHKRGQVYGKTTYGKDDFASLVEANAYVNALPEDFNPTDNEDFHYLRTIYGSEDWGEEQEYEQMDEQERLHYRR